MAEASPTRRLHSVRYSGPAMDLASASLLKRASALAPESRFRPESALPRKSTPRPRTRRGRVRRQEAALAYKLGATKVRCANVRLGFNYPCYLLPLPANDRQSFDW